ncbi:MAG: hypothetical protein KGO51_09135 [Alphaproteobacteria bacterium]|nr:hypothetical protein [Alphaproteobacteria bacterium]
MLIRTALALAVSLTALNAQASDLSRIAEAFGNTILSIYPDGRSQKIWLHADGTWDGLGRNNQQLAGHWKMKGDRVCLRQSKPPTLPFAYCAAFPSDPHIGATWTSKDFLGTPIRLTVIKGMPQPPGQPPVATR